MSTTIIVLRELCRISLKKKITYHIATSTPSSCFRPTPPDNNIMKKHQRQEYIAPCACKYEGCHPYSTTTLAPGAFSSCFKLNRSSLNLVLSDFPLLAPLSLKSTSFAIRSQVVPPNEGFSRLARNSSSSFLCGGLDCPSHFALWIGCTLSGQ